MSCISCSYEDSDSHSHLGSLQLRILHVERENSFLLEGSESLFMFTLSIFNIYIMFVVFVFCVRVGVVGVGERGFKVF